MQNLNSAQLEAVISTHNRICTLAGAGTGKTATLTGRIAYLNQEQRVSCHQMLALTFTRLAGREMKERVIKNIGKKEASKLFANTMHAFSVKVLKEYGFNLGYGKDFTIYDQDDSVGIINSILKDFGYKNISTDKILEALCIEHEECDLDKNNAETIAIIKEYNYRLKQNNAFDFNGLISNALTLFSKYPDICNEYRKLYKYVFIDEMQDTNDEQWELIKLLNPENLFVVGDFRQSIYNWRGANVGIILSLVDDPEWQVINLRQNYRSTIQIVNIANTLISHSQHKSDNLITNVQGGSVEYKETDSKEARWMALTIGGLVENNKYSDIAVLTRTNKQLENIKPEFDKFEIPVEIVNNKDDILTKNYIRMIFSYLELAINPMDNIAFKRAINYPKPRMTDLEMQHIIMMATDAEMSLYGYVSQLKHHTKPEDFHSIITDQDLLAIPVYQAFTELVECLKLREYYTNKSLQNRIDGIDLAISKMSKWCAKQEFVGEDTTASAFFKWLRIRDIQEKLAEPSNRVKLMTVHAAKGLEFDSVFVAGMNQGVFPSKKGDLEEERRLFYVALTRAKRHLYISRPAKMPDWSGYLKGTVPSQFIDEAIKDI
jgi:DNA helicase-2/ATP-dependent DNA helicase PcrA